MALFDYVSICVCYFVCFFFFSQQRCTDPGVQNLSNNYMYVLKSRLNNAIVQEVVLWVQGTQKIFKGSGDMGLPKCYCRTTQSVGPGSQFPLVFRPENPFLQYLGQMTCLLHLSLVVFASFPSSFLSWSTPIIKLPIRPTWTEEKRGDKNVTLVVSQVRDIGTSFGIHGTKQFTNQTVIIKRQSEVHLQGLNSNTSHTLPLG